MVFHGREKRFDHFAETGPSKWWNWSAFDFPGLLNQIPCIYNIAQPQQVKVRSHMRGAVAEWRQADFDIPAPLPWVCSHMRKADAGGSAISWGQRWVGACGFEADAENWVLDPLVAEGILLPLRVWTHVMLKPIFRPPPHVSAPRMCERTFTPYSAETIIFRAK